MPSRFTSDMSKEDALSLAKTLGIQFTEISIEPPYQAFLSSLEPRFESTQADVTEENIQARIRGTYLMAFSNKFGHLVLSTGNKSELSVGYCTLYGDMAGGLACISDVPKTLVYKLSRHINKDSVVIPNRILERPPSAELREGQTDQERLPPYPILDAILKGYIEDGLSPADIVELGHNEETVVDVIRMVEGNEYKRLQAAPGLKVTPKAFGPGRRHPIARKV